MIRVIISGDYCPSNRVSELLERNDFDCVFNKIKPLTTSSDYSIVNFESTILTDSTLIPISKCGPNLSQSTKTIEALKYAGFNAVTLANNHFSDFGHEGAKQTLNALDNSGLDYVGGGSNLTDAAKVLYKSIKGQTVAFVNFCENEFTIARENTGGANPLNPVDNFYQIAEARKQADYVIVIIHGGPEHYQLPTPRMQKTYRFFVDSGANVVVNHHQHCYSGYELYKSGYIFYGLGNFSFDIESKRNSIWNEGFMLALSLSTEKIEFELIPYIQGDTEPGIILLKEDELDAFHKKIKSLNEIISNPGLLAESYCRFIEQTSTDYITAFSPYLNNRLRKLKKRKLLPAFIAEELAVEYWTKDRTLNFISFLQCESHTERCLASLKYHFETNNPK